jgi:PKD repeat protein
MTIINSSMASGVLSNRGILLALILLSLFIFAPILASAATYYIAPSGSNSNPGTQAQPFATLQRAHDVAVAGDTIYLRGGTYLFPSMTKLTRDGASGNRIKVFNFPGEVPVIDGINQPNNSGLSATGIILMTGASWWHIKGLELKNGPISGIWTHQNSSNNIFEQNNIHHMGRRGAAGNQGTGLAIMGPAVNNLVINNDVHDNDDELSFGGGANGINVSGAGSGHVIRGNRAWRNADDGIDMWNSAPALIENNWVWLSGYDQDGVTPRGNGIGFKLGGSGPNDGGHTVQNNLSWKNRVDGFHENGGDRPMKLYNNTAWNNGRNSLFFLNSATTFRNNTSHDTLGNIKGSTQFNSWTLPVTVSNADFGSLDFTCASSPRQANGSLPNCSFLRLVTGSDLINKGTNVGIPYTGSAPDLGAFEYGGTSASDTTPPPSATSPTVSITAPANGATVSGTAVTVSATASDDVGVAGVQFKLDGANLGAEDNTSPYSVPWNSTTTTNGPHTLTAVARDAAGNTRTSAGVSVTVNNGGSSSCTQTPLNVSTATSDGGFAYIVYGSFGTPADNSDNPTRSVLKLFENTLELGPAHSSHANIRNLGQGRFSHWSSTTGTGESIRFAASNNTDPRTNGRSYRYCVPATASATTALATSPPPASDTIALASTTAPRVNFSTSPNSGAAPLAVTFTNSSSANVTSYSWNFGDGSTSTEQNPVHTYAAAGTYSVILTATGPDGTNTETGYITVLSRPVAAYNFEEASGSKVIDASGQGNHGTRSGNPRITQGRFGKALSFDGLNDWVTVNDAASLDLTTGMTVEAWVYPTESMTGWRTLLTKESPPDRASYYLQANSDMDQPATGVFLGDYQDVRGGPWLRPNTWVHLYL